MVNIMQKIAINKVKKLYNQHQSLKEIAKVYSCSPQTILNYMTRCNIPRRQFGKEWAEEEKKFLKDNFRLSNAYLSSYLNRSKKSIEGQKKILNLRWSKTKEKIKCKYCHKIFTAYNRSYGKRNYCSLKCWNEDRERKTKTGGRVGFCIPNIPNLNLSPNLAYILGVMKGDGYYSIFKNKKKIDYKIHLFVKSKPFAENFALALERINLHTSIIRLDKYFNNRERWRVNAYSKNFIKWYKQFNLEHIYKWLSSDKKSAIQFIKGFYEAEGCCCYSPKKHYCQITIVNSGKNLLKIVQNLLLNFNFDFHFSQREVKPQLIDGRLAEFKKPVFVIVLSKKAELIRFLDLIKPCIKHKDLAPI